MIREGRRSDTEALLDALERLNEAGTQADPRYVARPDARERLRAHLSEAWFGRFQPFPACWVDEHEGGVLAGMISGAPKLDHPILDLPPTATIETMWVAPEFRRQRVGRTLVDAFRSAATKAGYGRIEVVTLARDARAVAFWRSVGFDDLRVTLVG